MHEVFVNIRVMVDDEELIDAAHPMGITNEAYTRLCTALGNIGYAVADVERE